MPPSWIAFGGAVGGSNSKRHAQSAFAHRIAVLWIAAFLTVDLEAYLTLNLYR